MLSMLTVRSYCTRMSEYDEYERKQKTRIASKLLTLRRRYLLWIFQIPWTPRTSRTSQAPQRHPETSRDIQRHPETSRDIQRHPETSRDIQRHPETSRDIQRHPETSRDIQRHPETSERHPRTRRTRRTHRIHKKHRSLDQTNGNRPKT